MSFQIDDRVRIAKLLTPERDVTGSVAEPRQPRAGEIGTIVDDVGDGIYLVERTTDDGSTQWLAEFAAVELALVDRRAARD